MTVGIFGSSGFLGSAMAKFLHDKHAIVAFKRSDLEVSDQLLADRIKDCDCLVNFVGAPIIRRWTKAGQKEIRESRVEVTDKIINAIRITEKRPAVLINSSAIGIYNSGPVHDENSADFDKGFLGSLVKEWEVAAFKAKSLGLRVAVARLGVVIGKDGGLLKQVLPLFKVGLGGRIGNGNRDMSFIGIQDLCRAAKFIIESEKLEGIFNFTCPQSINNSEFTFELSRVLRKPAVVNVPEFALKLFLGEGSSVILNGPKAFPARLLESGFVFKHQGIKEILDYELVLKHG